MTGGSAPAIPGYAITGVVGRGGFATVYAAAQDAVGGQVAIKVIDGTADPDSVLRFRREVRALGALRGHPHIVTVLDAGTAADGRPYLVMQLVDSGSLQEQLVRRARAGEGPLPAPEVTAIGVKVASALAAAHVAGILHRDVKPGNVLLDDYGQPLLTDFGIARLADHDRSVAGTALSAGFTAPEVVGGDEPTIASDVFALGCTLYALLTGASPFRRPGDAGLLPALRRTVEEPAPDLRARGVPDALWQVLARCLAKDPAERPGDMVEVVLALQQVQESAGAAVTTVPLPDPDAVPPSPPPAERPRAQSSPVEDQPEGATAVVDVEAGLPPAIPADPDPPGAPADADPEPHADQAPSRHLVPILAFTLGVLALAVAVLLWQTLARTFDERHPLVLEPGDVRAPAGEDGPDVALLYVDWAGGINAGDYDGAHDVYADPLAATYDVAAFEDDFEPLYVRDLRITEMTQAPTGLDATIEFLTTDAAFGPESDAGCTVHEEHHVLVDGADGLGIAAADPLEPPRPC